MKYHYGFTLKELYGLGISQFNAYVENLGYVLGNKEEKEPGSSIYNPDLDPALHPELKGKFNQILGAKKK